MKAITITDTNYVLISPMYLYGRTLKEWAKLDGKTLTETTDGKWIIDEEMYEVSKRGIWLVP